MSYGRQTSTSTSRVGRPRTKSAHQTPCVPVVNPKVGRSRSKSAHASKITDSSKNTKVKKMPGRPPKQVTVVPLPEQRVIEIESDNSDIEFPFHPERLPDLPPIKPDQPNIPTDHQNQEANQPQGCGPGDCHFYLTEVPVLWMLLYSHWMPLVALATFLQV